MYCLEFRRRLLVDPHDGDRAIARHLEECQSCSRWYAEQIKMERRLRQSLDVAVPPGLVDRILLRHAFLDSPRGHTAGRRVVSLAASFVLGLVVAGALFWLNPRPSLARDIVSHVDELAYVLDSRHSIGTSELAALLGWMGAELKGTLGEVRFANLCTLRDRRVAHLVIAGTTGPVTVMIMPAENIGAPTRLQDGHRRGRIVPYRGGALAILSERPEPLDPFEERIRANLEWRASDARTVAPRLGTAQASRFSSS